MPYRESIIGNLDLVEIERDGPIPVFLGRIQDQKLIVRFDTGALAQLVGKVGSGTAVIRALGARAPAIKSAAQALLKNGFWTETEDGVEILITALDL